MTEIATPVGQSKNIYWVGGGKGGVGKSMLALASLDYLVGRGEKVLLVECDTSNADVWKAYHEEVEAELVNLDEANGWIRLVNVCHSRKDSSVVINTGARNNLGVSRYGLTLDGMLEELGRKLVVLWMINRQRDSLELLKEFAAAMPHSLVHVVRNGHFGDDSQFELYNGSKVRRELVEARGGRSVTLPDLADRVADDLFTQYLSAAKAARTLPIGNRAELSRWRAEVRKALAPLFEVEP
jgi:hypothetical protein